MSLVSLVSGAACASCPANGREWVMQVDVNPSVPMTVVLTAKTLTPPATGVFTVPVAARLAYQGLPSAPQPPATTAYAIDNNVGKAKFNALNPTIFAKPGVFKLTTFIDLNSPFLSCKQQVSINQGAGFTLLGTLGAVNSVSETLPSSYHQPWTLRVTADNTKVSTDTVIVHVDNLTPSVQITSVAVLTHVLSLLKGFASDDSNSLSAVEVSLNGGPFKKALLGDGSVLMNSPQATAGQVAWALPINASGADGEQVQVVARAVDAAGNVSPNSSPVMVTLDAIGPAITVMQIGQVISGTVSDGSGVAQVQVSLDGGVTYQNAALVGSAWSFDRSAWTGGPPIAWVVVRALDVYGNMAQVMAAGGAASYRVFLPVVIR